MTLFWLIFLHHLADVAFQPSWLIKNKHKHWFSIYEHVWVWTGVVGAGLWFFTGELTLLDMAVLFIGHFLMDSYKYSKKEWWWIYPDQAFHYLQVIFCYYV